MTKELPLFSDDSCFVEEDPKSCGFYDIEGPDLKRWIEAKAVCRCRLDVGVGYTTPCLMVRADARKTEWGPYLMPSVEGRGVGLERIQGYGAYYFPFPAELLAAQRTRDSVEVRLETLFAPDARGGDSRQIALAIFELRIVDLNRDSFPERQEFLLQRKIFETRARRASCGHSDGSYVPPQRPCSRFRRRQRMDNHAAGWVQRRKRLGYRPV